MIKIKIIAYYLPRIVLLLLVKCTILILVQNQSLIVWVRHLLHSWRINFIDFTWNCHKRGCIGHWGLLRVKCPNCSQRHCYSHKVNNSKNNSNPIFNYFDEISMYWRTLLNLQDDVTMQIQDFRIQDFPLFEELDLHMTHYQFPHTLQVGISIASRSCVHVDFKTSPTSQWGNFQHNWSMHYCILVCATPDLSGQVI